MKNIDSIKSVIIITTDKVYKNIEKETFYSENCTLGGYDIYSSSKACCEILTESYRNSFYNLVNDINCKRLERKKLGK